MEKLKDETRHVSSKLEHCPRCNGTLEVQIERSKIVCQKCGLIIKIESKANILRSWLGIAVVYAVFLGIGCIVFSII